MGKNPLNSMNFFMVLLVQKHLMDLGLQVYHCQKNLLTRIFAILEDSFLHKNKDGDIVLYNMKNRNSTEFLKKSVLVSN